MAKCLILFIFSLNAIFSIAEIAKDDDISLNFTENITKKTRAYSISKNLDIYNIEILAENWQVISSNLSDGCVLDMEMFLEGLESQKKWALTSKLKIIWNLDSWMV